MLRGRGEDAEKTPTEKEAKRKSRVGMMNKAFKFPPDAPSDDASANDTTETSAGNEDGSDKQKAVPTSPKEGKEGTKKPNTATKQSTSGIEVPPPPPVEKERAERASERTLHLPPRPPSATLTSIAVALVRRCQVTYQSFYFHTPSFTPSSSPVIPSYLPPPTLYSQLGCIHSDEPRHDRGCPASSGPHGRSKPNNGTKLIRGRDAVIVHVHSLLRRPPREQHLESVFWLRVPAHRPPNSLNLSFYHNCRPGLNLRTRGRTRHTTKLSMLFLNVYDSYKTLKPPPPSARDPTRPSIRATTQRKRDMKGCLAVWVVWCCFTSYERMVESLVSIFVPFYDEFKSMFMLFLIFTRARGAEPLFLHIIRPIVKPYTSTFDGTLEVLRMSGDFLFALSMYPIHVAKARWDRWRNPPTVEEDDSNSDSETTTTSSHRTTTENTGQSQHNVWIPPPSAYNEEQELNEDVDAPPEIVELTQEERAVDEWRQYPAFPSAYPTSPLLTTSFFPPNTGTTTSFAGAMSLQSSRNFQNPSYAAPANGSSDLNTRFPSGFNRQARPRGPSQTIYSDDEGGHPMDEDDYDYDPHHHSLFSGSEAGGSDDDEEDVFNMTLRTPLPPHGAARSRALMQKLTIPLPGPLLPPGLTSANSQSTTVPSARTTASTFRTSSSRGSGSDPRGSLEPSPTDESGGLLSASSATLVGGDAGLGLVIEGDQVQKSRRQVAKKRKALNGAGLKAYSDMSAKRPDGTPHKLATTLDFAPGRDLKTQGLTLIEEIGPVLEAHSSYLRKTFKKVTRTQIDAYINSGANGFYGTTQKRWQLPRKPSKESKIYEKMVEVINDILDNCMTCPPGVEREAVDTHSVRFHHKEDKYTSPDIVILATGPSFERPEHAGMGYSNIATYFDVKRECDMGGTEAHIIQLSIYARQVLAHQPNRFFIRGLVLSEETCRLVHFDRSGAQVSPAFDIHANPDRFIRLVVGLSDPDERSIGIDDSIQWTIGSDGRKERGTLTYKAGRGPAQKYALISKDPIAVHVIRGRATTCWAVRDEEGNEFIVKDTWASAGRTPEYKHLKKAQEKGVEGVCQIVSYQASRGQTKDFRCATTITSVHFFNRISSRIVMKAYGKHLQYFKTILQLLSAFHDAIVGHMKLLSEAKILHRDINDKNVLLGKDNDPVGWRGVLIDLNVAIDFDNLKKRVAKEARTGSRFFQSCAILDYLTELTSETPPAHDYLDDLEAFFFLLCWIFLRHLSDGAPRPSTDVAWKVIAGWDSEKADEALKSKSALFNLGRRQKRIAIECVRKEWGDSCATLFRNYLEWVGDIQVEKERLCGELGPQDPTKESIFKSLLAKCDEHYMEVLGFFEEAIVALGGTCQKPSSPVEPSRDPGAGNSKRPRSPVAITKLSPSLVTLNPPPRFVTNLALSIFSLAYYYSAPLCYLSLSRR
ncbi:hypothetical protein NMY22_g17006 [Coprinellus aureogranulatus]|nr:hypothetical protein NMY22_g17006 [Coprinellus aureogranulatus]